MTNRLADAIRKEAARIGADPADFATAMSFETGGTFDPWQQGPVTKWGRHIGLIQMGEPQREKYGYYEGMPIEDAVRASADYLVDNGFKPGMSGAQLYATINTGSPNGGHKSDAAAGGTWGSADDKWNHQMEGHRAKAAALLGGTYVPQQFDGFTDADGRPNAALDYEAAYQGPKAVTPNDYLSEESQRVQPYGSWLEEIGAQYRSNAMTAHAVRAASEGTIDPLFEIGEARAAELVQSVPEHYQDFIMTAGSEEVLRSRVQWMTEDMDRQQKLAAGGWSAMGAGLVAGVIDPIPLAVGVATGGLSAGAAGFGLAGRVAVGAAAGAAENAALEVASGELLDNPNADPGMAAVFGGAFGALGGALARGPGGAAHPEAAKAYRIAGDINAGKERLHADPIMARDDSLSAARNTTSLTPLMPDARAYDTEVNPGDAPRGYSLREDGKDRFDVTGQMTTSDQPLVRVLGAHLGEEVAGFTDHSVVPDSASSRMIAYHRKAVGNYMSVARRAEAEYLREVTGIRRGLFHPIKAAQASADFNRQVRDWVLDRNPSQDVHPSVAKAGTAFRNGMAHFRDEMERVGLATLNADPHYVPMVPDASRIAELDVRVGEDTMAELLSAAIRAHSPHLSPEVVSRMSVGYWRNIRRAGWGMENDMDRAMSTGDRTAFKEALMASLGGRNSLTEAQIEEAFDAITGALDGTGKDPNAPSSRGMRALKRRTLMDYTFKATVKDRDGNPLEVRVADFFRQDAGELFQHYARSMSGRIALAETRIENPSKPGYWITEGIRGDADVAKLREAIIEEARAMGKDADNKDVANQLGNLDFFYKKIAGIPVWDQSGRAAQWARRIKQSQFIRLMSNMGLNQVQEGWKIATLTGFRAAYDQMPSIRGMVAGIRSGKYQADALAEELQAMTGIGVDGLFSARAMKAAEERVGEKVAGKFDRAVDGTLDHMSEVTSSISLMRAIHGTQSTWAASSIIQQMANMARLARTETGFDLSRLAKGDRDRLATMGLGAKDARTLFRNLLDHAEFDGRRVVQINHHRWDADAVSKARVFIGRYVDRLVQANDPGGLAKWMSHPVASMLVQFRTFTYGSWHKSTLWAMNHGAFTDPRMQALIAGEVAMGAAMYAVRSTVVLAEEDGWDKYKERILNPTGLLANGFARTASASIIPMLIDSTLIFTPAGPQFGQARSSGTPTDAFIGIPAADHLRSLKDFSRGSMEAAFTDKPFTKGTAKAGVRAFAPFGNWLPFAAGFSALTRGLPER
ncbi:hypothetical protein EYF88_11330 [Paracoccus sediminis]|uniref:Transglycosylase SLT domain-containing protein n=1 Tax=Paracoccus sediminis TaxID=1214787 RepID=A0A238XCQ0_9RHOB|nr:hypothetical protein [Paracoccus sediminis]TBN49651.1 hypothetical protein EYF88_11330 [Paracoccus sediminis]SNR56796.1 hypothetical protein SAMN06265378_10988 [Paracoccus sediminis]